MWDQILFGVIVVTWFPAGLAASGVTFAITARKHPKNFLKNYWMSVFAFLLMVILGWVWFWAIILAAWLNPELRNSGILFPGRQARNEARRILADNIRSKIGTLKGRLARKKS